VFKTDCLLCGVALTTVTADLQEHPETPDCDVRHTDAWGVAITKAADGKLALQDPDQLDISTFPFVDEVLGEIFEAAGVSRLGGISSGRGWSSFSTFQRCPHAWNKRYQLKVKPTFFVESPALAIGSLIHTYLAVHYIRMMDASYPLTPEAIFEKARRAANPQFVDEAWRVFIAYRMFYINEVIQPLAVEYDLRDPRSNESCRFDLVAFFPDSIAGRAPGTYVIEHKCLESQEKVQDYATGKLHTIGELHAKGIAPLVLAYDEKTRRMVKAQAEVPRPTTVRDVYDVLLASGQRLRTSENHPFLTARGWVPAAELTDDDWVALAPSTGGFDGIGNGGHSEFTDAQVEFVGLMLGDGCLTTNSFTKDSKEVADRFITAINVLGHREGAEIGYRVRHGRHHSNEIHLSIASGSPSRELLERLGLWGHLAATKFIPDELLAIPDRQILVLLGALWNTDGCVDVFEERSKLRPDDPQLKVRIAYVSRSKALCLGVQRLLQRVGLPSSVTESSVEYRGERRDVWTTKVNTREGKRRFLDGRIPFVRYAVTEALAAIKPGDDAQIPSAYVTNNVIDNELTGILRSQLKINRTITRDALMAQGEKKGSTGIHQVLTTELAWSRVTSVVISGRSMMYDLTVPGPHTFVANGIITHNSASRFDDATLTGWVNDGEVLGQVALWQRLGLDHRFGKLQGVIVNLLGKHKEPQFHRTTVSPESWQVDGHLDDLKRWEGLIQLSRATNNFPRARASCISRFGKCDYFDACSSGEG
jgi:intein/homing endonuclease